MKIVTTIALVVLIGCSPQLSGPMATDQWSDEMMLGANVVRVAMNGTEQEAMLLATRKFVEQGMPLKSTNMDVLFIQSEQFVLPASSNMGTLEITALSTSSLGRVYIELRGYVRAPRMPIVMSGHNGPAYVSSDPRQFVNLGMVAMSTIALSLGDSIQYARK